MAVRAITTIVPDTGGVLRGASWGPDNTIIFATQQSGGLLGVSAFGGDPARLTTIEPGLREFLGAGLTGAVPDYSTV